MFTIATFSGGSPKNRSRIRLGKAHERNPPANPELTNLLVLDLYLDLPLGYRFCEACHPRSVSSRVCRQMDQSGVMGHDRLHRDLLPGLSLWGNLCVHTNREVLEPVTSRDVHQLSHHLVSTPFTVRFCADTDRYLHAAMAISTDFAIVLIPIPTIINVKMENRKKWSLAFTFALGGLRVPRRHTSYLALANAFSSGCVTSIVRLYYLHYLNTIQDKTFYYPIGGTWSAIELNVVIICACLITLHPLLAIVLSPIKRYASQYSQRSRNTTGIAPASEVHRHTSKDVKTTIHVMEEGESVEHLASEDSHVIKVSTTIDMRTDRESISESQRSLRGARSENDFRGGMWQDSLEMHPIAQ